MFGETDLKYQGKSILLPLLLRITERYVLLGIFSKLYFQSPEKLE